MKKVFGIAALLLGLVACNKIETENQITDRTDGIPFSATVSLGDNAATKALAESDGTITATWAEGEKVALIHNGVSDEMEVTSVSGGSATITGTITTPSDGESVTIIYPSSAADGATGNIKADLLYAQDGTLAAIASTYEARKGTGSLKVVDGTATLSGSVSLTNQFAIFKFTVKNYDGTAAISAKPLTITIGEQDYVITPAAAMDVLYVALPAVSEEKVSFDATDSDGKTYTCAKISVSFEAGKYYQSTLKMREYVDLGDGLKWATMNVGATSPEEYGDYFAWGETSGYDGGKTDFSWATYKWMQEGQSSREYITKYTFADGQTGGIWYEGTTFKGDNGDGVEHKDFASYDYVDDAARANWGGSWRTPTDAELTWLRDNCTWKWKTTSDGYAKNGMLVTSKVSGYEGNSIFLPAAGGRNGTSLGLAGSYGGYWSSSLYERYSGYARDVYFGSSDVDRGYYDRYNGQSVRPVSE